MTQMLELVDKDNKTSIVSVLHMFIKLKEELNMLGRDIEYILKKTQITLERWKVQCVRLKIHIM